MCARGAGGGEGQGPGSSGPLVPHRQVHLPLLPRVHWDEAGLSQGPCSLSSRPALPALSHPRVSRGTRAIHHLNPNLVSCAASGEPDLGPQQPAGFADPGDVRRAFLRSHRQHVRFPEMDAHAKRSRCQKGERPTYQPPTAMMAVDTPHLFCHKDAPAGLKSGPWSLIKNFDTISINVQNASPSKMQRHLNCP